MKTRLLLSNLALMTLCVLGFISCNNDDVKLIDSSYKTLEFYSGFDLKIPVLANDWNIESVEYLPSGETVLDKNNNPLALKGNGEITSSEGWLTLKRDSKDGFVMSLKENFDPINERRVMICINSNKERDYITVIQKGGSEYRLVNCVFEEIEEEREIYTSAKDCSEIILTNNTSEPVSKPTGYIFKNVVEFSHFESNDYGAFSWIPEGDNISIIPPTILIDGENHSMGNSILYSESPVKTPYIKDLQKGISILVQPYSEIRVKGEITYCKRICKYTLTVENNGTGNQFEVDGIWTQIYPLISHTIIYEPEE
ncbi:hypothetical protein [Dysgonomonas massiliensis]|uniref:hypothetical protein n=1 Tax=Dysgonomonas massiliensis TaxID=2040292 RepID=UPI0011AF25F3|nr:hypothetical protein [Dysgonomonas massiliensis]